MEQRQTGWDNKSISRLRLMGQTLWGHGGEYEHINRLNIPKGQGLPLLKAEGHGERGPRAYVKAGYEIRTTEHEWSSLLKTVPTG